jgi:RNA polymerase sigma factor (sigma-70 family)
VTHKEVDGPCLATTADVLGAAVAGNTAAWSEIVHRYKGTVRAAVGAYRLEPADAADAMQNTWLRLFERAATIRDPERLGGWLRTTARRECLAFVRLRRAEPLLGELDVDQPSPEPSPEASAVDAEMQRRLQSATGMLATRPRALVDALFYLDIDSYRDIADRMGIPIGSIGPTRLRALRTMRRSLCDLQPSCRDEKAGLCPPVGACGVAERA